MITKTVSETREGLADLLGRVQHGGEEVTIMKHGKPVAAIISIEALHEVTLTTQVRCLIKLIVLHG